VTVSLCDLSYLGRGEDMANGETDEVVWEAAKAAYEASPWHDVPWEIMPIWKQEEWRKIVSAVILTIANS
jgi:hypothetical protein